MNENLKFSWGHIMAFLALIAISYTSFVGFTYLTNGNFTYAFVGMGVTDFLYILFFIGAQQMKASGVRMTKKIKWERIFLFGSPIIFVVGMFAVSHFWTVCSKNDAIVNAFITSINSSKQLFRDYETYANRRLEAYEKNLSHIIENRGTDEQTFRKAGFKAGIDEIQKENMMATLRLQLLSVNYEQLKADAVAWIDNANHGANTWNVFLLGNTRQIKEAIEKWENQLKSFSTKTLSNEAVIEEVPQFVSNSVQKAIDGIDGLTNSFTEQKPPKAIVFLFGIVIYVLLLFPYFLQERHTKSPYRNILKVRDQGRSRVGDDQYDKFTID